jgi:hypothetical protein
MRSSFVYPAARVYTGKAFGNCSVEEVDVRFVQELDPIYNLEMVAGCWRGSRALNIFWHFVKDLAHVSGRSYRFLRSSLLHS